MAGDPWSDVTRIGWDNTYDTTVSTPIDNEATTTYCSYSYNFSYIESEDYFKKIAAIIRKAAILEMKKQWTTFKNEFKPVPKMRPSAQLRGVCLNGRGWA